MSTKKHVIQRVAKDLHDLDQCQFREILRYALDDIVIKDEEVPKMAEDLIGNYKLK